MAKTRKDIHHLNAGEWSQKVYNRSDHDKHASACRQAKNVVSTSHGLAVKRKGFELVAPSKFDDKKCNLVRFRFSKTDTVCLEVGHLYVRFHVNGVQVRLPSVPIESIAAGTPTTVTSTAHGLSNGDEIYVSGLTEMVELNDRWLVVSTATTDTYRLEDRDGNYIDSTSWASETTGGSAEKVYEIVSPYEESDLENLDYAQKNDVMWFCDGAHPIHRLIRFGSTDWTISEYELVFPPALDPNVELGHMLWLNKTAGSNIEMFSTGHSPFLASHVGSYWVLRHLRPAEETSTAGVGAAIPVLGNVTFETGGTWNGTVNVHRETGAGTGSYIIVGTYTSVSGQEKNFNVRFTEESETRNYYLSGDVDDAVASLRSESAIIEGAVKVTTYYSSTRVGVNILKDVSSTAETQDWSEGAWSDVRGYPSVVCLFEKAIWFARTGLYPQGIWKSETDLYDSFQLGSDDTDGLFLELDSKERNDILWMVPQDKLIIGTSGSEWTLSGTDLNSIISPSNVVARRQESKGSEDVRPEAVDDVVMYMQRGSNKSLRSMAFSIERDRFHASNMQTFSEHLTLSGVTSMAFQGAPDPVLWLCTGDGKLLSFTYERDQNVYAWNPHETNGLFEDVETIYGQSDDEVWASVNRTINGTTRRFVERLTGYYNPDGIEAMGLVAFIIDLSQSMQDDIDEAKIQSVALAESMAKRYSSSRFALYTMSDVGNTIVKRSGFVTVSEIISLISELTEEATGIENGIEAIVRCANELPWSSFGESDKHIVVVTDENSDPSETQENAIAAANSIGAKVSYGSYPDYANSEAYEPVRVATGGAHFPNMSDMVTVIEPVLLGTASRSSEAVFLDSSLQIDVGSSSTVRGLWHLEGETVFALVDGYVESDLTVTNGSVTLTYPAISAYVGLQYEAVVQPLRLDADGVVGSTKGYTKVLSSVYASLLNTIGLKYCDGNKDTSGVLKYRDVSFRKGSSDQTLPPQIIDGDVELITSTGHTRDPIIILKSDAPLPFTLAGLVLHYDVTGE